MDDILQPAEPKPERMRIGPLMAIIILILIFVVGGIYFFLYEKARLNTPPVQQTVNA